VAELVEEQRAAVAKRDRARVGSLCGLQHEGVNPCPSRASSRAN
jgi:hypothetical protein